MELKLPWPLSGRECVVLAHMASHDDGSYTSVVTSTTHEHAPETSKLVRAQVRLNGMIIRPVKKDDK